MIYHQILVAAIYGINDTPFVDPISKLKRLIQNSDLKKTTADEFLLLYHSLADCQESLGEIDAAIVSVDGGIRTLEVIGKADQEMAELYRRKASLHLKNKDVSAVGDYARALRLDPQVVSATFERELMTLVMPVDTTSDIAASDDSESLKIFIRALTRDLRGRKHFTQGNYPEAQRAFTAAIDDYTHLLDLDMDPDFKILLFDRRGQLLLAIDMPEAALKDFDELIQTHPHSADHYLHRGEALLDLTYFKSALEDLKKAIELAPRRHRISRISHEKCAHILIVNKKYDAAILHLQEALVHHPAEAQQLKLELALAHYFEENYYQAFLELTEVEAALDTLDTTTRHRLQRKIKLLIDRIPFLTLQEEPQADPAVVEHRRNQFRDVVDVVKEGVVEVSSELKEHCELGFVVIHEELAAA